MTNTNSELGDAVRCGNEFWGLCDEYRPRLEPRCEAGAIDGLNADIAALTDEAEAAINLRIDKKAGTLDQAQALEQGAGIVSLMRNFVRRRFPEDKGLQKKFGVGERLVPGSVESVAAGLKKVAEASQLNPERAHAAGILPEDLVLVTATHTALTTTNQTQETKKVSSKQATALRNETHLRVERTIASLYAIAQFVFRNEPQILERFTNALPPSRSARARAKRKAAALHPPTSP